MKSRYFPFYILTVALFVGLIVPVLIQDGMFMDGMLYTCVSKNLGNGIGTFWFPVSDATWMVDGKASFHEHPPLVFAIQSVFFKVFGNSMYVERFYIFLTACITALLVVLAWKEIDKPNKGFMSLSWLPILLWIIVPVAHWTFQNNMQENTMGIFSFLSILFILKAMNNGNKIILYLCLAGISVFLASLSKGVPGFFPIGTIAIYWLIYKKPSFIKVCLYTSIIIIIPLLIYFFLMFLPDAKEALSFYAKYRLFGRIESSPTVTSRFHTIKGLFSHLIPVLLLSGILILIFWRKSIKHWFTFKKEFLLFILIGCSASLPLMLTMIQKDFYFSHSIPYFGLAFAFLLAPGFSKLTDNIDINITGFKIFKGISLLILLFAISYSIYNIGDQSRDKEILYDVHKLGKIIPNNSIIDIEESLHEEWAPRLYLVRYYNISTASGTNTHEFLLLKKESDPTGLLSYKKIEIETKKFNLFKKMP